MIWILSSLVKIVLTIVPLLIGRAFRTVAERKIRSSIQRRQGPAVVGRYGLLQPFADAIKLLTKETVVPSSANNLRFRIAPRVTFTLSLLAWAVRPLGDGIVLADVNLGRLYLLMISSLGVYGIVRAGWASNSKYPFLGALRSAAQMVSYEVSIGFILVSVLICSGSSNLSMIVEGQRDVYYRWPLLPRFLRFFVSVLAETNRHPFDLPEAEAELVSGYNVEYSAAGFVLFFLGEYVNRILRSRLTAILFRGGWLPRLDRPPFSWIPGPVWLAIKTTFFLVLFIYARAAYPRYRYDQLRRLGWKVFLPVSRGWVVFTAGILVGTGGLAGV